jgi:hypothetical protein
MQAPTNQSSTSQATACTARRELAHRTSDGIEVTLFWSKPSSQVTIALLDSHSAEAVEFEVDGSTALDAFNHPYAYAATHQVRHLATTRTPSDGPTVGANQ